MRKFLLLAGFVFLNSVGIVAFAEFKNQPNVATSAPLTLLPIGAESLDFKNYRGKVVLLDFWASWCGPCRQSFPWMNEMQTKYADQGLVVIAVNLDQEKQVADKFLNDIPANFSIVYDPSGRSAEQMDVMGMPMSYLIDRQGHVRHRLIGFNSTNKTEHENHISALLSETMP